MGSTRKRIVKDQNEIKQPFPYILVRLPVVLNNHYRKSKIMSTLGCASALSRFELMQKRLTSKSGTNF